MNLTNSSTKSSTKKSEETRARILEAALAVFRERGFSNATMREIAAQAQVASGAAYYYFDSKDAIVMAFYERSQDEMVPATMAKLDEAINSTTSGRTEVCWERFRRIPTRIIRFRPSARRRLLCVSWILDSLRERWTSRR